MSSKQDLKRFLEDLSENATFPVFNFVSAEKYSILMKCQVDDNQSIQFYNDYAREWIKKFSKFTQTSWIVRSSFPKLKRLLYRKVFVCQHSSFNKKKADQAGVRNKECKAKVDFKIKFINRNTIRNDKSLKEGLNLNIYIEFTHTHGVRARESFHLIRSSSETNETFYKYFSQGHTVISAKRYHELALLSKYGGASGECSSNADINPNLRHISYLFRKKKGELNHDVGNTIAEKKKILEEAGGVMQYTDDYSITVVITPFMKNVLTGHDLQDVIIDSTPMKECVVSFFLVPTPLGALPIACALHSQNNEPSYSQAFFSTKLLLEYQTFKTFEPKNIMINAIDEQEHALDAIFSNKQLFISRASMAEEIWKTMCDGESKVEGKKRHSLMVLFHSLLYADDDEDVAKYYKELEEDQQVESTPKLKEYLKDIWNKRSLNTKQHEDQLTYISIRTLRQFLLSKCSTYNNVIMIDVLLNILDSYWCQILHAHLKGKLVIETYTKFLAKDKTVMNTLGMNIAGNEYRLDTEKKLRKHIIFRSDTLCCDCCKGVKGRLCEHLCAVLHSIEVTVDLPEDKRSFYTALAGEDVKNQGLKLEPAVEDEQDMDDRDIEETSSNEEANEYYYVVKQEMEEFCDPLDDNEKIDNCIENSTNRSVENEKGISNSIEINVDTMKYSYAIALKALNDEFRRLSKVFKDNPNASNLNSMGRLARELSKIRPVEKVNLNNLHVELNDGNMGCH